MNEITVSFTIGQMFAVIGSICLVAITIYLVGVLKETKKTLQQLHETLDNVNEIIDDVQTTKMVITTKIAELQRVLDFSNTVNEVKQRFTRKKKKKGDV